MTNRFSPVIESLHFCKDISLCAIVYCALPDSTDRHLLDFCLQHNLPVLHNIDEFAHANIPKPDFLAVFSLHKILSADEITLPKVAALNMHPSLLPLYKGANPWQEQFKARVKVSGFTIHKITSDIDGGEIISRKTFKIDYSLPHEMIIENALRDVGGPLFCRVLSHYNKGWQTTCSAK